MDATPDPPRKTWEEIEAEYRREMGITPSPTVVLRRRRRRTRNLVEWGLAIGGALLVAWFIQSQLVQAFVIPSSSMEPTLEVRDRVLVNKLTDTVGRGDVIVFRRPPGVDVGEAEDLIKRVIGVGGDVVQATGGVVMVNGEPIDEPYLPDGMLTEDFAPVTVPDGTLFVMGDNRAPSMSYDSRYFGPIDEHLVVGRAFLVVWPLSHLGGL
jgi:signal peptidase I